MIFIFMIMLSWQGESRVSLNDTITAPYTNPYALSYTWNALIHNLYIQAMLDDYGSYILDAC